MGGILPEAAGCIHGGQVPQVFLGPAFDGRPSRGAARQDSPSLGRVEEDLTAYPRLFLPPTCRSRSVGQELHAVIARLPAVPIPLAAQVAEEHYGLRSPLSLTSISPVRIPS